MHHCFLNCFENSGIETARWLVEYHDAVLRRNAPDFLWSCTEQNAPVSKASRFIKCYVQRVCHELLIAMPGVQEALVISLARANDEGHTTVVFCLAESGPFRLRNQNNRYIWPNQELRENGIDVGSIIAYERVNQGCLLHTANTGKKLVSVALQISPKLVSSSF